ncbi:monocarboxylate transporter 5-like [Patiria miniata]|uniref:Major facilitator superfamily (MFS) profile domain-containing protein n=1 Tax=Patiria miniata TaxID=46514 RepID=A0A913Z8L3_PATMI|nr:monocarboxylate transporter 5-like [Patiria miniata]
MGRKRKENAAMDLEPEPPDSGWAWVVLCSVFVGQFLVIGFLASVSVYVYVWIAFFNGSAAETSLVISLCTFMMGVLSPIAGSICKRFGPRVTVMAGGTMTCVGLVFSSQATGIIFLIISLGLFTAFGISMTFNAGFTVLGMYFKKRLAMAIGLATAGTSIGQLALPPLFQYLIDQYGWRGSLMITSALAFHVVAAGALMRPLVPKKQKRSSKRSKRSELEDKTSDATPNKNCQSTEVGSTGLSFLSPSIFGGEDFVCSPGAGDTTLGEGSIFQGKPDVAMTIDETEDEDRIEYTDSDSWSLSSTSEGDMTAMNNNVWVPVAITTLGNLPKERRRSYFRRRPRSASMVSQTLVKKSSDLIRLLRNPSFLVLMAVSIGNGFGRASTTYHLVSRAESINIEPDNAALLLTLMGAGSLIGRLSIGWIVDRNWMRPELCYTLTFGVCALATFITPLITEFKVLVAVALVHGASSGAATVVVMMTPRLVVKPWLASTSMAYFLLAWGVGEISGGALAGWFYDALKSYDYSFYAAGSVMTSASALMLIIYFLQRAKRRRQGHHAKSFGEQAGSVQPGSNQLDPELAGSMHDDLGRVNPVFSTRKGFETCIDLCEGEIMGESVSVCEADVDLEGSEWSLKGQMVGGSLGEGCNDVGESLVCKSVPVSEVDAVQLASQSCQSNAACNRERSELSQTGQTVGGSVGEGCNDVGESLGIENPINENDSDEDHANYTLSSQSDTHAEVHKKEIGLDENETPGSVTGPSQKI